MKMKRQWEKAFLTALEQTGSVTAAAKTAKISRERAYECRRLYSCIRNSLGPGA